MMIDKINKFIYEITCGCNAIKMGACVMVLWQLSACEFLPIAPNPSHSAIFYPPLPNTPRIQYLTTLNATVTKGRKSASEINKPYGVAYYNGQVFVVDTRGPSYFVLDVSGKVLKIVKGTDDGLFLKPINITLDSEGNRYVADTGRGQVLMFDSQDKFVRTYGIKGQYKPSDVLVDGSNLYVADLKHHRIHVMDKNSGAIRRFIGKVGSRKGQLFFPTNLSIIPGGNIIVSDTGNYRLQVFSPGGSYLGKLGEAGSGLGQFARPKGVAVDKHGRIYVVDSAFENIQLFNGRGQLLMYFGKPGNNPDNINLPADITIDYDGIGNFKKYADNQFLIEYLIFVSNQFGPNKINVYGFGKYRK